MLSQCASGVQILRDKKNAHLCSAVAARYVGNIEVGEAGGELDQLGLKQDGRFLSHTGIAFRRLHSGSSVALHQSTAPVYAPA